MDSNPLLGPVVALVGWTIVMLIWTVVALAKGAKTTKLAGTLPKSTRARDVETMMDERFSYPRRNYEHLVEQPTLFYAVVLALAVMGDTGTIPLVLGWAYVGFRVIHSLVQVSGKHRGVSFAGSSLCLLALLVYSVIAFLG